MVQSGRDAPDWTLNEARARLREAAEALAVRLRWLSVPAIPALAYFANEPVESPWFQALIVFVVAYNLGISAALVRGGQSDSLSAATAILDSVTLTGFCLFSGGFESVLTVFYYLAVCSVSMRLPIGVVSMMGGLYSIELAILAWHDGRLLDGELVVKIAYVFLMIVFVSPLVAEARTRLVEVLAGHEAQRRLLHRLLRTEEDERRRVASELHDRGGGALFSMLHGLRRLRGLAAPSDRAAAAEIDHLIQVTEEMVHDLRTLLADLRPRLLDDLGLAEALRELLTRERALSGLPVSFEVSAETLPEAESSLALYRVAQEAFTNIRRHAAARSVNVRLHEDEDGWSLEIADDGRGLNGSGTGLGLQTMRERVEALGGRLEIRSGRGSGTRVEAQVPRRRTAEERGGETAEPLVEIGELHADSSVPR